MSSAAVNRRRQVREARAAPVGAESPNELLYQEGGPRSDGMSKYLRLTGRHAAATNREVISNMLHELIGVFIISAAVQLVSFQSGPTQTVASGATLGLVYALAYYVAVSLPRDLKLKAHCNPAISAAYGLGANDIGFFGFLLYIVAQSSGGLMAGGVVGAILSQETGATAGTVCADPPGLGACTVARAVVPLPVSVNTGSSFAVSQVTVICMEIFMPAVIALVLIVCEYLNTKDSERVRNYYRAVKITAAVTGVLVTIGYPFQMFMFNGSAYLGGLASGFLSGSSVKNVYALSHLPITDFLPNSVFGTDGANAWALYFFGPWAGGVAAGIFAWLLFMLGFLYSGERSGGISERERGYRSDPFPALQEPLLHAASQVRVETQTKDLITPFSSTAGTL